MPAGIRDGGGGAAGRPGEGVGGAGAVAGGRMAREPRPGNAGYGPRQ